jgi:hypothetical protein
MYKNLIRRILFNYDLILNRFAIISKIITKNNAAGRNYLLYSGFHLLLMPLIDLWLKVDNHANQSKAKIKNRNIKFAISYEFVLLVPGTLTMANQH